VHLLGSAAPDWIDDTISPTRRQHVSAPIRIFRDTPPKLTAWQEADLIGRGMPERLVRNGNLDYASLVSGSMADRLRNGCC
jgi:hypothetical protein